MLSQSPKIHYPVDPENLPLESTTNLERLEKLSDCMEELEMNMRGLQNIHESLTLEFNESFASFLYGLLMTMWCVHFPGRPSKDQWEKVRLIEGLDDRIAELKLKLRVLAQENEKLKKKLQEKTTSVRWKKQPEYEHDRVSKIPTRRGRSDMPNLDQPPRYMRGILEGSKKRERPPFR